MARQLRILRLNDLFAPHAGDTKALTKSACPEFTEAVIFDTPSGDCDAIDGWATAIDFWCSAGVTVPDVVVADVHFEHDLSSPLNGHSSAGSRSIPTGLSHLKPVAAMARSRGNVLGVAIHTADPGLWERLAADRDRMAMLAAHEIGELAAILGDRIPLDRLGDIDARCDWCWRWLDRRTTRVFSAAVTSALQDYRLRLVNAGQRSETGREMVSVGPEEHARLLRWCGQQSEIQEHSALKDYDQHVTFSYADGRSEAIEFRSLFADCAYRTLRVQSFATGETEPDPTGAYNSRTPELGRFIAQFGGMAAAFHEACELLERYPPLSETRPRVSTINDWPATPHTKGLALVLHLARREFMLWQRWAEYFSKYEWDPAAWRFGDDPVPGRSLSEFLKSLHANMPQNAGEPVADIQDAIVDRLGHRLTEDRALDHVALLLDCGAAATSALDDGLTRFRAVSGVEIRPCHLPEKLPAGFESLRWRQDLSLTFGFRRGDTTSIRRIIARGFLPSRDDREAIAFLERLRQGRGPEWLHDLARRYAQDVLRWTDSAVWPPILQAGVSGPHGARTGDGFAPA